MIEIGKTGVSIEEIGVNVADLYADPCLVGKFLSHRCNASNNENVWDLQRQIMCKMVVHNNYVNLNRM